MIAEDSTRYYNYKVAEVVSFISQFHTLHPGDVVSLGTAFKPGAEPQVDSPRELPERAGAGRGHASTASARKRTRSSSSTRRSAHGGCTGRPRAAQDPHRARGSQHRVLLSPRSQRGRRAARAVRRRRVLHARQPHARTAKPSSRRYFAAAPRRARARRGTCTRASSSTSRAPRARAARPSA